MLQVDKEYLVRKANEQAIKQKIMPLYDQVFIQHQSQKLDSVSFGTPCIQILWKSTGIKFGRLPALPMDDDPKWRDLGTNRTIFNQSLCRNCY